MSFAYSVAPNKTGTDLQGGLILIRITAEGGFEMRSNALDGLAVGQSDGVGWASFTGKATYVEPGWDDRVDNHTFTAYFRDAAQLEDGEDTTWIQVRGRDGQLVDGLSLLGSGSTTSVPLIVGDVVVPAPAPTPGNKKKTGRRRALSRRLGGGGGRDCRYITPVPLHVCFGHPAFLSTIRCWESCRVAV